MMPLAPSLVLDQAPAISACAVRIKSQLTAQVRAVMAEVGISKAELARRMGTSRSAVHRLLDPTDPSLTLSTLASVAEALKRSVAIELVVPVSDAPAVPDGTAVEVDRRADPESESP